MAEHTGPGLDPEERQDFEQAVALSPTRRAEFLNEMTRHDEARAERLRVLLDAHDRADAIPTGTLMPEPASPIPDAIGPYRILGVLGRGGMGTVYEALQEEPERRVAIKVMSRGLTTRSALRRFAYESRILGRLQHPGIAQIHAASTMQDGTDRVPYFVMELVEGGQPITEYARSHELDVKERVRLLMDVCAAVHHGHVKGIVHRDLKPDNILVDRHGRVKIIDFGVARTVDEEVDFTTLLTGTGQLIGTLEYMSPEQMQSDTRDVDARSDVYALGVVGQELLTGELPYDLRRRALPELSRIICEEPPRRLGTGNRELRGQLEWIVETSLAKLPGERYQSAEHLRTDLDRYLQGLPISARPPGLAHQIRLLTRRHRGLAAGLVATFVSLVIGVVVSVNLYLDAEAARVDAVQAKDRATDESRISRAVNRFFNEDILGQTKFANPNKLTMREVLDTAAAKVWDRFQDRPQVAAVIHSTLGAAYGNLGMPDLCSRHYRAAYELQTESGVNEKRRLDYGSLLGSALYQEGKLDEALELLEVVLAQERELLGDEHTQTQRTVTALASLLAAHNQVDRASELLTENLDVLTRTHGEEHQATLVARFSLTGVYWSQGELKAAADECRHVVDTLKRINGEDDPLAGIAANRLGRLLFIQDQLEDAREVLEENLQRGEELLGEGSPLSMAAREYLTDVLVGQGELERAEELAQQSLDLCLSLKGTSHPQTCSVRLQLGKLWLDAGLLDEAEAILAEAVEHFENGEKRAPVLLGELNETWAHSLIELEWYEEAEQALLAAHRCLVGTIGPGDPATLRVCRSLVDFYESQGDDEQANQWRRRVPSITNGNPVEFLRAARRAALDSEAVPEE